MAHVKTAFAVLIVTVQLKRGHANCSGTSTSSVFQPSGLKTLNSSTLADFTGLIAVSEFQITSVRGRQSIRNFGHHFPEPRFWPVTGTCTSTRTYRALEAESLPANPSSGDEKIMRTSLLSLNLVP
jgi:hypothetical protein